MFSIDNNVLGSLWIPKENLEKRTIRMFEFKVSADADDYPLSALNSELIALVATINRPLDSTKAEGVRKRRMGCGASSQNLKIDDSIHAVLRREKEWAQQHGEKPHTYRPRDPHPCIKPELNGKAMAEVEEGDTSCGTSIDSKQTMKELDRMLELAESHCNTVDCRDVNPSVYRYLRQS